MANQDVKFKIINEVTGMEQMAALINRMGALETQMASVIKANAGLAASNDAVVRNGVRYNNAIDAQSKALKQARQGAQQLGMQFNDLATSISTGAKPSQAFNQQLGQMGFALSMMEGRLGAVGRFLAGPWGAAITLAVMAIAPLIDKLWETVFAADEAGKKLQDAAKKFNDSLAKTSTMTDLMTEATNQRVTAMGKMATLQRQLNALQGTGGVMMGMPPQAAEARLRMISSLRSQIDEQKGLIQASDDTVRNAIASQKIMDWQTGRIEERYPKDKNKPDRPDRAKVPKIASWLKPQIDGIEKLNQQLDAGVISWSEYSRALLKISDTNMKADNPFKVMAMDVQSIAEPLGNLQGTLEQIGQQGMDSIRGYTDEMKKSFDAVGMSVNDAFKGMLTAGMSWKDGMRGIIQSVINELWRLFVVQQIVGLVSNAIGGAFGGGTARPDFSGVGSIASPMSSAQIANLTGRAIGGSVGANTPYIVGERGPELFVPRGNGTIIPNKNMGGGSASTINVSVDARGASDPAAVRAQVQQGILEAAPAIVAAAEKRTIDSLRRPRLGGAMQ